MPSTTKTAFVNCRGEGLCVGTMVYFHTSISDLKDASQTTEVENVQLLSNGFSHLPCLAHNGRSQESHFNLQRKGR